MSSVIKLGSARYAEAVTPYASPPSIGPADTAPSDPHREEVQKLRALLAERDAELEELRAEVDKARVEGEAAGRIAAEAEVEDSREKALELLRNGIEHAGAAVADCQGQMEVLALMIARTALDKLFGDDSGRRAAVTELVVRQLRSIERQTLLQVEVSRLDFPNTDELADLAGQIGVAVDDICANAGLAPGACRMRLRVGTLEVGLDEQWGAIRNLLDDLASSADAER